MNENKKLSFIKLISPIIGLFIFITLATQFFNKQLTSLKIDPNVLMVSNILLCILCCINLLLQFNATKSKNPNTAVRMVMLSTLLKFIVLASASLAYAMNVKDRSTYAIFGGMIFYTIYAFIEVRVALKMKKK